MGHIDCIPINLDAIIGIRAGSLVSKYFVLNKYETVWLSKSFGMSNCVAYF